MNKDYDGDYNADGELAQETWIEAGGDEFMDNFLGTHPAQANRNPLLDLSADKIKIWLERVQKLLEEENA